jgi:hypothetical protein
MNTVTYSTLSSFALLFFLALPFLLPLALTVVVIIGMWKVFEKAGQPGWGCIIPIFNIYCLVKIAGKEWWWLLLYFIPLVNIIISIIVLLSVSQNFGKGVGFAVGLIFLPFIFFPILGFGDATYGPGKPPVAG